MMLRIWRLPEAERAARDLSSLRIVLHLARARVPPWLKQAWIDWLGPERIWELYGGTEAQAATLISGTEWLAHRGLGGPSRSTGRSGSSTPTASRARRGEIGEI